MEERPELFNQNDNLKIITDKKVLEEYPEELGVVYTSPYLIVIKDLVKDYKGNIFSYERNAIPRKQNGVIAVIEYKNKILMLKQFRHAIRKYVYDFVSGLGENGLDSKTDILKEIDEEIHGEIESINYLGKIVSDVGVTSDTADIFYVKILNYKIDKGYEGIKEIKLFDFNEIEKMIKNNEIIDSLTISSYQLYLLNREKYNK